MFEELPEEFEIFVEYKPAGATVAPTMDDLPEGFELVHEAAPARRIDIDLDKATPRKFETIYNEEASATIAPQEQAQSQELQKVKTEGRDVVASVENIHNKYSTMLKQVRGVWSPEAREEAARETEQVKQEVVNELARKGFKNPSYDVASGEFTVEKDGVIVPVDSNLLLDLKKSGLEAAGAGIAGTAGLALAGPVGAVALSSLGASVGRGGDILANQIDLVKKVDGKLITDQMVEAGIFDLAATAVGAAVLKPVASTAKWLKGVYNQVISGNTDGAYEAALNHYGVSSEEATNLVKAFENLAGQVEGTEKEKVLKVLALTKEGGEDVIDKANLLDPKASANVAKQIFTRAQDLLNRTKELAADNIQAILKDGLDTYTGEVKQFYNKVKTSSEEFTQGYQFDYDAIGLQPLLAKIGSDIKDPVIDQRFASLMTRIRDISEGRSFTDLIDLRQAVNDVKFSAGTLSKSDANSLETVLKSIDAEIKRAAETYIPSSKEWLNSWELAKREYSTMKKMENNILYKALTRPGLDEERVVKLLSKYISAGDNTFFEVVDKLPKAVRNRIDGAILNVMTEKYTAGMVGGNRAVNFPMLSLELKKMRWTSPQAKQTVRTIHHMAEVFKNDVNLARVSGNIEIPDRQSYLTTNPVVRLKYEIASGVFNYIKQLVPGDRANTLALIKNTASLMENPISNKAIKDMMRALPKDKRTFREKLNFDPLLQQLRQEYAGRQAKMKELYGKEAPPRLVWKKPTEVKTRELDSLDDVLYATTKGTVAGDPTSAIMKDETDDLISDFIWQATSKDVDNAKIVERAAKYMDNARFEKIINYTRGQLKAEEREAKAAMLDKIVRREADILIKRIQADFGVQLPKEEADKIMALKFKELLSEVYQ